MKSVGVALLILAPALLTGCPRQDASPAPQSQGYPPPGQWLPPQQPQASGPPPAYTPPGQWVPPAPNAAPTTPAPWWQPQPGSFPFPLPFPPPAPQGQASPLPQLPPLTNPFAPDPIQRCVNVVNEYRATARLPPLQRWAQNESCANGQARDGAATGQPHGAFGRCAEQGQNVCPAWAGPADRMVSPCIQSMWNEGPGADFGAHGHYINLSSTRFTQVACGFYTGPSGQVWLVQDFL